MAEARRLDRFDYSLPADRIAVEPASPRDSARLLVLGPGLEDRQVRDLPDLLLPGDLLVVNDVSGGAVFGSSDNAAVILGADGTSVEVPRGAKSALAQVIWDQAAARLG